MRLVRYHQVLIDVEDRFLHRDDLFIGYFAEIMNAQAFAVRQVATDRQALSIEHPAAGDPAQPLFAADGAEVITQAVQYGWP